MKKKTRLLQNILFIMLLIFTGCGRNTTEPVPESSAAGEKTSSAAAAESEAPVDLPGGEITVPSYLEGPETADLPIVEEQEGRVTYRLTGRQQTDTAALIAGQIRDGISEILDSREFYPHITEITVNEDYSEFHLYFSGTELNTYETTLRMSLYLSGDKYQLYLGRPADEICTTVHYIDTDTGTVFSSGSSCQDSDPRQGNSSP